MSCSKKKPGLIAVLLLLMILTLAMPTLGQEKQDTAQQLHQIFADYWQFLLKENPLMATARGDVRYNDRLSDESVSAYERRNQARLDFLKRIKAIEWDALSQEDRLNYDLFKGQLQWNIQEFKFKTYLQPVHQRSGFHLWLPEMHERIPFRTKQHYEDYLARLKAIPDFISQIMERLKAGARQGRTPPKHVLQSVPEQIRILTSKPVEEFPLFEPFQSFPKHLSESEREKLRDRGKHALQTEVIPAFLQFGEFYEQEYIPKATEEISASERYPDGEAFYAHRIERFTTTDMTAREIHDLGLKEVSRIKKRMQEIIEESGFEGRFQEFIEFLRTDEQFYYTDPEELLIGYRDICKRMDAALPKLFGKLPRAPYGVRAVPEYAAPQATTAYYSRPSPDGKRPGWFYANTYDLKSRPKYEMEALSLHEAVPGHHLQIALQQELENVPNFRTQARYTAFVEGWGLYAESLGYEVGFYEDPYAEFGALSYEMWRALRLVVDTGMHAFDWSRQRAINYMLGNSALTKTNVVNEVDRYIAWPGQALAYKIGQLKIRELRTQAENELGEAFDVRAFHDLVLSAGAIPLNVLEARVESWITGTEKALSIKSQ